MKKLKQVFNKICKPKVLIIIAALTLALSIGIPSLARYRNRVSFLDTEIWDGTVALQYHQGTGLETDPYIISNGSELAYFAEQLETTDYLGQYFELSEDIALNEGILKYVEGIGIIYIKSENTYYVDPYTGDYYENTDFNGTKIGTVNLFSALNNFKGSFNGKSFTIYGLYLASNNSDQLALFTNLNGNISNLYVENALIYGGYVTAGIASKATNSSIDNVIFNGSVIGAPARTIKSEEIEFSDLEVDIKSGALITIDKPFITGDITGITLTGELVLTNTTLDNTEVTVNEVSIISTTFSIDLGTTISDSLVFTASSVDFEVGIALTNLNYTINYEYATAAGIIGEANSNTISNVVNKGKIYSNLNSGGIVGVQRDTTIANSYNTGAIISNGNGSGLVALITGNSINTSITNCYNTGSITAPSEANLIHTISDNEEITITNSFSTSDSIYTIKKIYDAVVTIADSYLVNGSTIEEGITTGTFTTATLNDLYNKTSMIQNLNYLEFVSSDDVSINSNNVWIYETDKLPRLYIDEEMVIASIYAETYSWNNLAHDLETVQFSSDISYNISQASNLRPLKEINYYVHNNSIPLTATQIESIDTWIEYTDIEEITTEGFYIIYAKVMDYNDDVTYLNSDILVLDKSQALVNISLNDYDWNEIKANPDYVYVDRESFVTVEASDLLSGIASLKYYVSSEVLNNSALESIDDNDWTLYENGISIGDNSKKIIYVKATDNCDFVTYANTDYLTLAGYIEGNITLGRNIINVDNNVYITDKSTISLEFTYQDSNGYKQGYTHNLISNTLLPVNTKITLIDKNTKDIYTYTISTTEDIFGYSASCDVNDVTCVNIATYPLTLFKNTKVSVDENFNETDYASASDISENFKIVIDLANTSLSNNYDGITLYMAIKDQNSIVRSTLNTTIKTFNIYKTVSSEDTTAILSINTDYAGTDIAYNSNSTTSINLTTGFTYKTINSKRVYDTTNEDKNIGLAIKLLDFEDEVVEKAYLKNFFIRIGDNDYAADADGIFRINLNNGIENSSLTLNIITNQGNVKLANGNYKLNITSYAAYDGLHTTTFSNNEVEIPVIVNDASQSNIKYTFDVISNDSNKILNKSINVISANYALIQKGNFENPNIRVSLYRKNLPTAYDQQYTLVDLEYYISNTLISSGDTYVYYASSNPQSYNGSATSYNNLELSFITSKFDYTGYRLVFELYDGDEKIGTIENNFIVK